MYKFLGLITDLQKKFKRRHERSVDCSYPRKGVAKIYNQYTLLWGTKNAAEKIENL